MPIRTLHDGALRVLDYRCEAGPGDTPYAEFHGCYSLSYVRRGSFGCHTLGQRFDLVAGGFLVGCPGDEFTCAHDHHDRGDECLSIQLHPELLDTLGGQRKQWRIGALAPNAEVAVIAELAQAAAGGLTDVGLDEAGLALVARFLSLGSGRQGMRDHALTARTRRVVIEVAHWMEAHSDQPIDLARSARQAGLSQYHFLRTFKRTLGVTPHQYLLRCRLRRAARRLIEEDVPVTAIALDVGFEDISNFVRSFRRAAQLSPGRYRALAATDRNFLQEVLERIRLTPRD
jgi:AraC family transcriptional regulator